MQLKQLKVPLLFRDPPVEAQIIIPITYNNQLKFLEEEINMPKEKTKLVIASTTSTQNSGLFDILIPAYEKSTQYGVKVEIIAVGTGKAIRIAKKGEADMLFVHDPFGRKNLLLKDMV